MELLVRRKETVECRKCYGEGKRRQSDYHNESNWHVCQKCGGEGTREEWRYYWVDGVLVGGEDLDEMDGQRSP